MEESIFWVSVNQLINLASIAYVQFGADTAKIVFTNGEMITLEGKHSEAFARFARRKFKEAKVEEPGGFQPGRVL
jgi:hypothetical protein